MIPGICRVWVRHRMPEHDIGWQSMSYASRGYSDCERLVEAYEDRFGNLYRYAITPDADWACPVS